MGPNWTASHKMSPPLGQVKRVISFHHIPPRVFSSTSLNWSIRSRVPQYLLTNRNRNSEREGEREREGEMSKMKGSVDVVRPIEIECSSADHKTLDGVLRGFIAGIASSDGDGDSEGAPPLFKRIRKSFGEHAPHLREASGNSVHDVLRWTREGSALRPFLVISVGTITFLALTGLLVFTLFFFTATLNAIIISALMSLAVVGGFLALFFACLTAAYIGALLVAMFVISAATIMMIIAVLVATGWIGFFYVVWLAAKKSVDLTKRSLSITSSAISAYSTTCVEDN